MTITCALAWALAVLTAPLVLVLWATESRSTTISRYRTYGWSWKRIADRYGVSVTTVRRWSVAWLTNYLCDVLRSLCDGSADTHDFPTPPLVLVSLVFFARW